MIQTETKTESTRGQLGQGIYSLAELQLYVAFYAGPRAGDLVPYWMSSALNPATGHKRYQPDYSFDDLVSLLVVHELRERQVRLRKIKEAEGHMREKYGIDRPFVDEDIATDGVTVFMLSDVPSQYESANDGGGQQTHEELLRPYLQHIHYSGGRASAWTLAEGIRIDPGIQFGDPVVDGTRVTSAIVAESTEAFGLKGAAEHLGLNEDEIVQATAFERKLAALRR